MKRRFFLVLSVSGGAGHLRAAEALEQAATTCRFPIRVENHDCLDFTSKLFKKLYSQSYLSMVNTVPELWGYLYQRSETKPYSKKGLLKLFDHVNYRRYISFLKDSKPDAIICTHFLPYISISNEIRKAGVQAPFYAATTDFDVHQYWVDDIVERYYVYHDESAWQLKSKGISAKKVLIRGIPVHPEFRKKLSQDQARQILKLNVKRDTVLFLSGGFGVGHLREIVEEIAGTLGALASKEFTLLAVCGRNEKARTHLMNMAPPANVDLRVFGFVTNIHELMDASDLLISKSGGLTSAEALAKSLPMLIIDPIPGQETRNADLIVENGAGWRAVNLPNLSFKLRRLFENLEILKRMRAAASLLAKPNAANDILEDVYQHLDGRSS